MDKNKKSNKIKKVKLKKEETKSTPCAPTPTPSTSTQELLSEEESKKFIQQINTFLQKKSSQREDTVADYKTLHTNISEYLESFITFGYTFEGERVLIQHYVTSRDKDAMLEFLKNVFVSNVRDNSLTDRDQNTDDYE